MEKDEETTDLYFDERKLQFKTIDELLYYIFIELNVELSLFEFYLDQEYKKVLK